jgi:indolepyruvate ferredoxin oxidoreductase
MGKTYELAFRALAPMARLRGTRLDLFGRDPDRRLERALIDEYEQLILSSLDGGAIPYPTQVELARSVLTIKGYAAVKEAAVQRWRARVGSIKALL